MTGNGDSRPNNILDFRQHLFVKDDSLLTFCSTMQSDHTRSFSFDVLDWLHAAKDLATLLHHVCIHDIKTYDYGQSSLSYDY